MKDIFNLPYKNNELIDIDSEIWVDAIGFDGMYEVSNLGRIKSLGRWVSNGKSERWIKEKIRKQTLTKDGRLTCPLRSETVNVQALIFLSFNNEIDYNPKKNCVIHKNKIKSDNRLCNLKIDTISNSHTLNYNKKLLPHLKTNNDKKRSEYLKITHKVCVKCKEEKKIMHFEHGRNKCKYCRAIEKKINYNNRKMKVESTKQ